MVLEEGKVYPPGLGRKIRPRTSNWPTTARIGALPSVAGVVNDRSLLPQVFRGDVRPIGRAGEWLQALRSEVRPIGRAGEWLQSLATRPSVHEVSHFSQTVRERVASRVSTVRGKALASNAENAGRTYYKPPIIPPPWGPSTWPASMRISDMPSVIGFSNTRSMHPQLNKGERRSYDGSWISVEQDVSPSHVSLGSNFSVLVE